jgi:hypothetical protein
MSIEYVMGLGAIKCASDIAEELKDIKDSAARQAALARMQEHMLNAQKAQTALIERVKQLEQQNQRLRHVGPRTDLARR